MPTSLVLLAFVMGPGCGDAETGDDPFQTGLGSSGQGSATMAGTTEATGDAATGSSGAAGSSDSGSDGDSTAGSTGMASTGNDDSSSLPSCGAAMDQAMCEATVGCIWVDAGPACVVSCEIVPNEALCMAQPHCTWNGQMCA